MYAAPLVFVAGFFVNWWLNAKQDQQGVITLFEQSKSAAQRIPLFLAAVTTEEIAKSGAPRQTPATVAHKNLGAERSEPQRTNESDVKAKQQREENRHR